MNLPNLNWLTARVLLSELAMHGCKRVVISPGSRSTPLAHAAVSMAEFEHYIIVDERSAAYFALGLSKADGVPAILICTSGTATANYFPAVIEAAQSFTPLIVLTADRPPRLRNSGSMQTIDQTRLYGNYVRYFAEIPEPIADVTRYRTVRARAADAFAFAVSSPHGPVHLNVPFDEPLSPVEDDTESIRKIWIELEADAPMRTKFSPPQIQADPEIVSELSGALDSAMCGLIVAGAGSARTEDEAAALHKLGKHLGWPILADIVSGLRFHSDPVMPCYDVFLREETLASLKPDLVLSFGAVPTSKTLRDYLESQRGVRVVRIQPHEVRQDPLFLDSELVISDVLPLVEELTRKPRSARDSLLYDPFQKSSRLARIELDRLEADNDCEALFVWEAVKRLSGKAYLVFANSMSIRYGDALLSGEGTHHRGFALRGASGIDGTISHAAGIAAASGKQTLLVTGDLAFLHDLGGLTAAAKFAPNLRILLLNNDGGGIFHLLPIHEHGEPFEKIHGTPQGTNLSAARDLFGIEWKQIETPADLLDVPTSRLTVYEVKTSRDANYHAYKRLLVKLIQAVRA